MGRGVWVGSGSLNSCDILECIQTLRLVVIFMVSHDLANYPLSILHKSVAGRYRPVRVADGPITARYRFIKNASQVISKLQYRN